MRIDLLKENEKPRYSKIVEECGTVFNSLDWLKMFGDNIVLCGIYDKNNDVVGGFSLYCENIFGLKILRDPPFTPFNGPVFVARANNAAVKMSYCKKLGGNLAEYLDQMNYHILSMSINRNFMDMQPFIWKKYKTSINYTYIIDLSLSEEVIKSKMSAERRNDIVKAENDGLQVEIINQYEEIFENILAYYHYKKNGLENDDKYLKKILFEYAKKDNSYGIIVRKGAHQLYAGVFICDKRSAYYLIGARNITHNHHGAGALCIYEAIKYAKIIGLKEFDFEGSNIMSIEKYFRGFGGNLVPYYRLNKARLFFECILKIFKRELF